MAWLGAVALVPWLLTAARLPSAGAALSGLILGTVSGVLTVHWIAQGLESLGAPPVQAAIATGLVALWGGGIPWALFGVAWASSGTLSPWKRVAVLCLALFTVDAGRSYLPGGVAWALLGQTQWQIHGVAQLAGVGGVPLVSALVVGVNLAVAGALATRAGRRGARALGMAGAALGAYAALAFFGVPVATHVREVVAPSSAAPLEILLVQPDLKPRDRWSPIAQRTNLATISTLTSQALERAEGRPGLVIWPENTLTSPVDTQEMLRGDLLRRVRELGVPVLLGVVQSSPSGKPKWFRNSALWVTPEEGIIEEFDKTHAIPVVESAGVSLGSRVIEALLGLSPRRHRVDEGSVQRPMRGSAEFAVALCYEVFFPGVVAERRSPETAAILNLGNDSWFRSETPSAQQVAYASFRAIEQRLWLVRAVHGGASVVVDPFGRVVSELPFGERGTLAATIWPESPPGVAERLALLGLILVGGVLGGVATMPWMRRKVERD